MLESIWSSTSLFPVLLQDFSSCIRMDRVKLQGENMCALPFLVGFMVSPLVSHHGIHSGGHLICSLFRSIFLLMLAREAEHWVPHFHSYVVAGSFRWSSFVSLNFCAAKSPQDLFLSFSHSLGVQTDKIIISYNHRQNFRLYLQFCMLLRFYLCQLLRRLKRLLHSTPSVLTMFNTYNRALVLMLKSSAADPSYHLYDIFWLPFRACL